MRRARLPLFVLLLVAAIVFSNSRGAGQQATGTGSGPPAPSEGLAPATSPATAGDNSVDSNTDTENNADAKAADSGPSKRNATPAASVTWPLVCLGVGIVIVLGLIIVLKVNAFIALISAAMVVSLMAPGAWGDKIARVPEAFGNSAGGIGVVIALAAVIGKCMLDSGAADRVVRAFLRLLGEKRAPVALMGSGFILAIPVFFDTVFYLLVPLARSMHRRTGRHYLLYLLAISAGGAITHTLVPPTPGPLVMADNLNFDVGWMIMIGALVAAPSAMVGFAASVLIDRIMPTPMRQIGTEPDPKPLQDSELPSLFLSLLPVLLPVILISMNTVLTTIADGEHAALLAVDDITDWPAFRARLQEQAADDSPNPGQRILENLARDKARDTGQPSHLVSLVEQLSPATLEQRQEIIAGLNKYVLANKDFHGGETDLAFLGFLPNKVARDSLKKGRLRMKKVDAERMNRALLESAYPQFITEHNWDTRWRKAADISSIFGNASFALLISTIIAMATLVHKRGLGLIELANVVEISLMSGGVIILITAGGGAFGAMLSEAKVGDAIKSLFQIHEGAGAGLMFLVLGFGIASVLKVAQGSSTVAMITGSAMLAGIASPEILHFHPVYLATAIGAGSLVGSWMNDSGFWIFAKMGGLSETEALRSWSILLIVLAVVSFAITLLLASVMPLV